MKGIFFFAPVGNGRTKREKEQDISRVLFSSDLSWGQVERGNHLSRMSVARHLQRTGSVGRARHCGEPEKGQPWFHSLASNRGLPSQHLSMLLVRSYRTLAPLPRNPWAVSFCGTILTIARTGRYPASLVFGKPGLSSDGMNHPRSPAPTLSRPLV